MFLEITMVNLFLFAMATIGLTNILVYGNVLENFREWFADYTSSTLLTCYQCAGFWSGTIMGFFVLSHNPFGIFVAGLAGSFLSETNEVIKEYFLANSMVTFHDGPYNDVDDE